MTLEVKEGKKEDKTPSACVGEATFDEQINNIQLRINEKKMYLDITSQSIDELEEERRMLSDRKRQFGMGREERMDQLRRELSGESDEKLVDRLVSLSSEEEVAVLKAAVQKRYVEQFESRFNDLMQQSFFADRSILQKAKSLLEEKKTNAPLVLPSPIDLCSQSLSYSEQSYKDAVGRKLSQRIAESVRNNKKYLMILVRELDNAYGDLGFHDFTPILRAVIDDVNRDDNYAASLWLTPFTGFVFIEIRGMKGKLKCRSYPTYAILAGAVWVPIYCFILWLLYIIPSITRDQTIAQTIFTIIGIACIVICLYAVCFGWFAFQKYAFEQLAAQPKLSMPEKKKK